MLENRKLVDKVLRENRKLLECSEFMFAEDSGIGKYNNENIKVLVLFLSNGRYRSSSNTFNALYGICKSEDVFVDFCYLPYPNDINVLDSLDVPYIRGARSGFLIKDFDIIMVSVAVIKECINLPLIYNHDNVPMGIKGRENYPIIAMGGSSAQVLSIMCGDFIIDGKKDRSLVDIVNFGKGDESLRELISKYRENNFNKKKTIESLSRKWLNPMKLRFVYNDKGYITDELYYKNNKVVYSQGGNVTENFNKKIYNVDGSFSERSDILISYGCNGRGYCSFCLEGAVGGCWKEKSIDNIEKDIIDMKLNNWTECCGIFSYNANYHHKIENIVTLVERYYDRTSLLMGRADVYAKKDKYINLCKNLGLIKLSIAAEGMSDNIRNEFLNKRISREELHEAVYRLMSNGILTIKINYILTGREKDSDFEEWVEDIKKFIKYRDDNEYKTRILITITNLVIYDFTPLRYEPRLMGINSIQYKNNEFIKKFNEYCDCVKKLGVSITLYGSGMVNAMEQIILDLGYMGTSILVNSVVKDGLRYDREITKSMCNMFFKRVSLSYNIDELFSERDENSWFPSDIIDFNNRKNIKGVQSSYKDTSCEHCIMN